MKVWKAGLLTDKLVIELYVNTDPGDIAAYLTNLEYRFSSFRCSGLTLPLTLMPEGKEERLRIEFPTQALEDQQSQPVFLNDKEPFRDRRPRLHSNEHRFLGIVLYQNHFYCVETDAVNQYSIKEAVALIKGKAVTEERDFKRIRREVKAVDQLSNRRGEYPGPLIPEAVQLVVYARDNGRCVQCGSKEKIQFDYVVPFAIGGSMTTDNIYILCQVCRLRKPGNVTVLGYSSP